VAATMPAPGVSGTARFFRHSGETPAQRADGPSACPGDSSHERESGAKQRIPGHQQAAKPIRVRNAGEVPASGAGCLREAKIERWPRRCFRAAAALCFKHRAPGVPIACRYTWRRGRGETPGVPHAPMGDTEKGMSGFPRAGQRTEAMMRDSTSNPHPEEARSAVSKDEGRELAASHRPASFETHRYAMLLRMRVGRWVLRKAPALSPIWNLQRSQVVAPTERHRIPCACQRIANEVCSKLITGGC
jgi:hypothetical protein